MARRNYGAAAGLILLPVFLSCSVVRPVGKYFVYDSIRVYTDTSGLRVVNGDTIRYRNSRVITKEKRPIQFKRQEITRWEAIALTLLTAITVLIAVKR